MHPGLKLIPLALLLSLYGSGRRLAVDPVIAHPIDIVAKRLEDPAIGLGSELRYVAGWALSSRDKDFGGLSALSIDKNHFTSVSDSGAILRFSLDEASNRVSHALVSPLPRGCARDVNKQDRDSESIAHDPATGRYWIGFEWRNAICRSDGGLATTQRIARPTAMQRWSKTGGPEALVRLRDGRFLIFAEAVSGGATLPDLLVADRDPTAPETSFDRLFYAPPEHHFSPTDAAELPDGRLIILNRRFEPPAYFSARLSLLDPIRRGQAGYVSGKVIARFGRPGLTSNFEGVAVSEEGARTFIWLISDDNFLWIEKTYLLKFELLPESEG